MPLIKDRWGLGDLDSAKIQAKQTGVSVPYGTQVVLGQTDLLVANPNGTSSVLPIRSFSPPYVDDLISLANMGIVLTVDAVGKALAQFGTGGGTAIPLPSPPAPTIQNPASTVTTQPVNQTIVQGTATVGASSQQTNTGTSVNVQQQPIDFGVSPASQAFANFTSQVPSWVFAAAGIAALYFMFRGVSK